MPASPEKPPWLQLALAALPVVLAPTVAWLMSQRREARRQRDLEQLQLRLTLIDKLLSLRPNLPADGSDPLAHEAADVLADLEALRTREAVGARALPKRSLLARLLLLYPQQSRKAMVYRTLFYLFAAFGVLGLIGGLSDRGAGGANDLVYLLIGVAVYFAVAAAFRSAAVRDYIHHSEKDRIARRSGAYRSAT